MLVHEEDVPEFSRRNGFWLTDHEGVDTYAIFFEKLDENAVLWEERCSFIRFPFLDLS